MFCHRILTTLQLMKNLFRNFSIVVHDPNLQVIRNVAMQEWDGPFRGRGYTIDTIDTRTVMEDILEPQSLKRGYVKSPKK